MPLFIRPESARFGFEDRKHCNPEGLGAIQERCRVPTFRLLARGSWGVPVAAVEPRVVLDPGQKVACTSYFPPLTDGRTGRELLGGTASKPSQGGVSVVQTLASGLPFLFNASRVRAECCVDPLKPPRKPDKFVPVPDDTPERVHLGFICLSEGVLVWQAGERRPRPWSLSRKARHS